MQQDILTLTSNRFNPEGYWYNPITSTTFTPLVSDLDLFDQNGYDLTELEKRFALHNFTNIENHREHRHTLKQSWFIQQEVTEGAHLNHSLLFERKGYSGDALDQLIKWSYNLPLLHKIVAMRPKWGLDFSMDYADKNGNVFEILHWEWDSFSYEEITEIKSKVEPILNSIDWADAASYLINHKEEWHSLDFFAQSDWKCNYFGITKERFKMVIWS